MADNISKYNNSLTQEERRTQAQAAGIKSGEIRRENRIIKERINDRMSDDDLNQIIDNLIMRAKDNTRDFIILRDTLGQKPKQDLSIQEEPVVIRIHRVPRPGEKPDE